MKSMKANLLIACCILLSALAAMAAGERKITPEPPAFSTDPAPAIALCEETERTLRISHITSDEARKKLEETASRREEASRSAALAAAAAAKARKEETVAAYESDAVAYPAASDMGMSSDDVFCLAAVVCQEAGGNSTDIQMLVANVVINRVNSPSFPGAVRGVATQYMQYGMMWKYGVRFPSWADGATISQCESVARRILSGERVCPSSVVYQAEFVQGSGVYAHYNGFYFCYE